MWFKRLTFQLLIWLCANSLAGEVGAWYKTIEQIPEPTAAGFKPGFILLKTAAFSKRGALWTVHPAKKIEALCQTGAPVEAWITHRLSRGEVLTNDAATVFGKQLQNLLEGTCIRRVEIDLEPLPNVPDWLLDFLATVKAANPKIELRLAVPPLSNKPLTELSWNKNSMEKILEKIDGVDIMMYDTGIVKKEQYVELVKGAVLFALKRTDNKTVLLGLPAYQDKTKRHRLSVETLEAALEALQSFTPQQLVPLCRKKVRLAYYAGWTLRENELAHAKKIEQWYSTICKKDL